MEGPWSVAEIGWRVVDRFRVGQSFSISPHGVALGLGFLAGAYVFAFEGRRRGLPEEKVGSIVLASLVGGIVGARLFYVITHLPSFANVGDMLAVYQGGTTLIGGVAAGMLAASPIIWRNRLGFLRTLDSAAVAVPLGIAVGRVGDLVSGDHLGKPTSWLLAFRYHGGIPAGYLCSRSQRFCSIHLLGNVSQGISPSRAILCTGELSLCGPRRTLGHGIGVHPTALYDLALAVVIVAVVLLLALRARRTGILFLTFAALYGAGRIVEDRFSLERTWFGLTGSQWACVAAVAVSVGMLAWFAARPLPRGPSAATPADAGPAA
jgi:phosphatidylglycerol:prolipoprotein diacylglycerol transferase